MSREIEPKTLEEKDWMAHVSHPSGIWSLMYAIMCTHPNICYVVRLVSRYQSNSSPNHLKVVKRILRYLKGTIDYMLCYQSLYFHIVGYTNIDWNGDIDEKKNPHLDIFSSLIEKLSLGVVKTNHVLPCLL